MKSHIDSILDEVENCTKCPKLSPWNKFPKDVHGNLTSRAMIISEAPGGMSLRSRRFWRGASGQRLRKILSQTGKTLEDLFYLTDTVKCGPPNNRKPTAAEISNCKGFLDKEIQTLKPKYILVFGETALRYFMEHHSLKTEFNFSSLLEVQNNKGYHIIEFSDFKLIPLIHPSWVNVPKREGKLFMDYDIYKKQLNEVYQLIIAECFSYEHGESGG